MPIRVDCPGCLTAFQVGEQHAGKSGKCPKCRGSVVVPAAKKKLSTAAVGPEDEDLYALADPASAASTARTAARKVAASRASKAIEKAVSAPPKRTPLEILAAFRGEIRPVRPTLLYRAWILIIAGMMLLLPAIYVGLIGLVGYALFLHATENAVIFQNVRNIRAALAVYVAPLVVGGIVIAFMLKPLFAGKGKGPKRRKIDPSKEPLIAAFIDGVCSSVGAPTPSRIEVDCEVNASARLVSRAFSPRRELALTIGLPLVAGLNIRQFTGVLAHEFGHFSQGAGMRLSLLIRSINFWFARVVYERDEWDEHLVDWSGSGHGALMVVGWLARLSVWLTRRVLWALMMIGHLVSGFLSRQMEFDADRYEARMIGGAVFSSTIDRLTELNLANGSAHNELGASWRERRLPDDLPKLIQVEAAKIPSAIVAQIRELTASKRSGLFDTHPADRDRVARALAERTDGIFALDGPATDLFRDFESLSKAVTFDYYRSQLGPDVTRDQLYPISDAVLDQEVRREGDEAFDRFFLGAVGPFQTLPIPAVYPPAPTDPKAAKRGLIEARSAMSDRRGEAIGTPRNWGEQQGRAGQALAALALLKAGKTIKAGDFALARPTIASAEASRDDAEAEIRRLVEASRPFGEAAARRLATDLGLLELDVVAGKVPDGAVLREEARALYPSASALAGRIVGELGALHIAGGSATLLVQIYQKGKNSQDEKMVNAVLRGGSILWERLTELKWKVGDTVDYPFEHAQAGMTLGRFALPTIPDSKAIGDLLQADSEVQSRLLGLHRRVLGRLCAIAEGVERALGLPPIEIPGADHVEAL